MDNMQNCDCYIIRNIRHSQTYRLQGFNMLKTVVHI
jgi:hypothetical protein